MHKHANVWWSLQLHELCALHTDSLFPAALAAVLSSCAATVEPSLLRGTARRHRTGPAWASTMPSIQYSVFSMPCRKPWRKALREHFKGMDAKI